MSKYNVVVYYDVKLEIGTKHTRTYVKTPEEAEEMLSEAEAQPEFVRGVITKVTEEIQEIRGLTYG